VGISIREDKLMPEEEKPKTLADLEIDQKTAEVESADDTDHEHAHSDELTFKEDPGKVKRANGLLLAISLGGLVIVMMVAYFLIINFEGRNPITDPIVVEEPENTSLINLSGQVFFYNDGKTANATFVSSSDSTTFDFSARNTSVLEESSNNPTWQVSKDGNTIAYQLKGKNEIVVENLKEENVALSDSQIDSLDDWLLLPDGSRIIALVKKAGKAQLLSYNVIEKITTVGDNSFTTSGFNNKSRLNNGQDGIIRQFGFTSADKLTVLSYHVENGKQKPTVIDSPRFPDNPTILRDGLSPDGTLFIFKHIKNGVDTLGMASLNSHTVRTIYQASSSAIKVTNIKWGTDSRTLLVSESEGSKVKRLVRLDTGPLTKTVLLDNKTEGLDASQDLALNPVFSFNNKMIAFFNGNTIWSYDTESKALSQLATNQPKPTGTTNYGWYSRTSGN
jgi:hypothetical protein